VRMPVWDGRGVFDGGGVEVGVVELLEGIEVGGLFLQLGGSEGVPAKRNEDVELVRLDGENAVVDALCYERRRRVSRASERRRKRRKTNREKRSHLAECAGTWVGGFVRVERDVESTLRHAC
jgi:hypothetical protein